MLKYIILCLCVSLSGVLCDLDKEEGADCEWESVKGKCVTETRCLTTLDGRSPKQPVCSKKGEVTIVCCTDCELVNDTRNVVISPTAGMFWKDGRKARDSCLQYLKELPCQCKQDGFYGGIKRHLDDKEKCHKYQLWAIGGAPPFNSEPTAKYPHQALLGYGDDLESVRWLAGGSIISDRYILTAAHPYSQANFGELKFIGLNVKNRSDPSSWQTHKVKRFIRHPEYKSPSKYHDIGLIETETPIKFDENVLPACLHVDEESNVEQAVATTWRDLKDEHYDRLVDTIQTINLEKFTEEDCKASYAPRRLLKNGIDNVTQMCYGSKTNPSEACRGLSGEPLLIDTQYSWCVYTVIGVTSFGTRKCGPQIIVPDVYTRVAHYVPWIESVVWP